MARWIVVAVVAAMVLPLAACKRTTGEAKSYDRSVDPPPSLVSVTIDPNIRERQEQFNNVFSATPIAAPVAPPAAAPAARTEATPPPPAAADATDDETATPAEPTSLIDTSIREDNPPGAEE